MDAPANSYWSIEACGWVRSPAREVTLPRPAEPPDAVLDLTVGLPAEELDLPSGAPV